MTPGKSVWVGKTPKPLRILLHPALAAWPEIQALRDQGHTVEPWSPEGYDLLLGPTCWRMDEGHRKYLTLAIRAGRGQRYPKERHDE